MNALGRVAVDVGLLGVAGALVVQARAAGVRRRARPLRVPTGAGSAVAVRFETVARRRGIVAGPAQLCTAWVLALLTAASLGSVLGPVGAGLGALTVVAAGPLAWRSPRVRAFRARRAAVPGALEHVARELRAGATVPMAVGELASALTPVGARAGRGAHVLPGSSAGLRRCARGARLVATSPSRWPPAAWRWRPTSAARPPPLDALAQGLRDDDERILEARALATQGRLSAIVVGVAPIGAVALASVLDERSGRALSPPRPAACAWRPASSSMPSPHGGCTGSWRPWHDSACAPPDGCRLMAALVRALVGMVVVVVLVRTARRTAARERLGHLPAARPAGTVGPGPRRSPGAGGGAVGRGSGRWATRSPANRRLGGGGGAVGGGSGRWATRSPANRRPGRAGSGPGGRGRRRRVGEALGRELAVAVELVRMGVGAGLTPAGALGVVAGSQLGPSRALAIAVADDVAAGLSFHEAARRRADHCGDVDVARLLDLLSDGQRSGAPLERALGVLAADLRTAERRRAEERARAVPVKLVFPLVFLALPSFVLLTVAPAVLVALDR